MQIVKIGPYEAGQGHPLLIMALRAGRLPEQTWPSANRPRPSVKKLGLPYVFKASFDKANRSSLESFRGPESGRRAEDPGPDQKKTCRCPSSTCARNLARWKKAAEVLDIIQIPHGNPVNGPVGGSRPQRPGGQCEKGQFLAPWDKKNVVHKITGSGCHHQLMLNGASASGTTPLVTDIACSIMREMERRPEPVCSPYGAGSLQRLRVDRLFLEVHDNPAEALSDGPNMIAPGQAGTGTGRCQGR